MTAVNKDLLNVAAKTITASATLSRENWKYVVDDSAGDVVLTLPSSSDFTNKESFTIVKTSSNAHVTSVAGISGPDAFTMTRQWDSLTVTSTGSAWVVTSFCGPYVERIEIKSADFTAEYGTTYITYGPLTVTDPAPVSGNFFRVMNAVGSVTVGGVSYPNAGFQIDRSSYGGTWTSWPRSVVNTVGSTSGYVLTSTGDGAMPTFQAPSGGGGGGTREVEASAGILVPGLIGQSSFSSSGTVAKVEVPVISTPTGVPATVDVRMARDASDGTASTDSVFTSDSPLAIPLQVATTNRSRTSNVATLTVASHTYEVGDVIAVTLVGGTGYNTPRATITAKAATTISYASTGSDEGTTADTAGRIDPKVIFKSTIDNGAFLSGNVANVFCVAAGTSPAVIGPVTIA